MGMLFQHDESGNAMLLPPRFLAGELGAIKSPTNNHGKGSTNASRVVLTHQDIKMRIYVFRNVRISRSKRKNREL